MNKTLNIRVLVLFTLLFSLFTHEVSAQSTKALIKRYKAMPEVTYTDLTDTIKSAFNNEELINQGIKAVDVEFIKNHFKKAEALIIENNEKLVSQVWNDLKQLKDCEPLMNISHNPNEPEGANSIKRMMYRTIHPSLHIAYYGKGDKEYQDKLIYVLSLLDQSMGIVIWDGKIKTEDVPNFFTTLGNDDEEDSEEEDDDDDDNVISLSDIREGYDSQDALIVIDGKIHPELHSFDDAKKYMNERKYYFNNEAIIVGNDRVREKYPDSDKKVAFEFTKTEEEKLEN